jgi:hypothetical protein
MCGNLSFRVTFGLLAVGDGPCGLVVLHHRALIKIVLEQVCVVGSLLEVIDSLSCLVFEVALGGDDELLVRIVRMLVIVALIAIVRDHDPLGSSLGPPLVAFHTSLCALTGCLEWHPSLLLGTELPSPGTKMAPTTSLPKACLVVMLSSSFVVFG